MTTDTESQIMMSIRLPRLLVDAIDRRVARDGYGSRSEAIRQAVREWAGPDIEALRQARHMQARSDLAEGKKDAS